MKDTRTHTNKHNTRARTHSGTETAQYWPAWVRAQMALLDSLVACLVPHPADLCVCNVCAGIPLGMTDDMPAPSRENGFNGVIPTNPFTALQEPQQSDSSQSQQPDSPSMQQAQPQHQLVQYTGGNKMPTDLADLFLQQVRHVARYLAALCPPSQARKAHGHR